MPINDIILVTVFILAFGVLAVTLAWAEGQTRGLGK